MIDNLKELLSHLATPTSWDPVSYHDYAIQHKSKNRHAQHSHVMVFTLKGLPFAELDVDRHELITTDFYPVLKDLPTIDEFLELLKVTLHLKDIQFSSLCAECKHKLQCKMEENTPRHNKYGYCDVITMK